MLNVAFDYDKYKFTSVAECDINALYKWMKKNDNEDNVSMLDEEILYRRFLECYVTDDEFFIKVLKDNEINGIIKGSIDRGRKKELFLWFFAIKSEDRHKGEGKRIINIFLDYICKKYKLINIKTGVSSSNIEALNFWKGLGFKIDRVTKKFFQVSDTSYENLIVMNKEKRIV